MKLRRTWAQRLLLVFNLVVIFLVLGMAWLLNLSWEKAASVNRVELSGVLTSAEPLTPGSRVINILLVGSDSSAGLDPNDPIAEGRIGERNGDVVIIAHLDERDGAASLLSLPRDLWVTIADTERDAKINSAYAAGGAATLIDTIEQNFGIPINYFVNVDFAGFEGLVDAVGSVDVHFEAPARDWNATHERSQTGFEMLGTGCQSLDPPTALAYVRSRYYQTQDDDGRWVSDPYGDLSRIRRQQDFLQRLVQRAVDLGARNPFILADLIDTSLEHVTLDQDLTPKLLLELSRNFATFEPGELETYSFPVISDRIGTQDVLIPVTEEAEPLIQLFNGAPSDDPATVRTKVLHAATSAEAGTAVVATLRDAGFNVGAPSAADLDPGIVVRHGPDGASAAALVAEALGEEAAVLSVDGLRGRDVVIAVGPNESPSSSSAPTAAGDATVTGSTTSTTTPTPSAAAATSTSAQTTAPQLAAASNASERSCS